MTSPTHSLAIIGATGKLAAATLSSILKASLLPPSSIIATTSAPAPSEQWTSLSALSVTVRHATFDDLSSVRSALSGAERVLLVSSPRIAKDFGTVQPGHGREEDHIVALEAAAQAGVKHVYYTSLGFGRPSKAGVMRAHIETEEWLERHAKEKGLGWTVIREGLYNESWPLYLGHWDLGKDERTEVQVAGDGVIPWVAIQDLGVATARIVTAPIAAWNERTVYLVNQNNQMSLEDVAKVVSEELGKEVKVKLVPRAEHERFYIEDREMDSGLIKWWASTYDAMTDGECNVADDTLERLLAQAGHTPTPMEDTMRSMLKK